MKRKSSMLVTWLKMMAVLYVICLLGSIMIINTKG